MRKSLVVLFGVVVAAMAVQAEQVPFTDKDLETEESMWNLYERWRAVYASPSGDLAYKISRFEVFKKNARYVSESNKKKGMTYKLGLNKFSDMTMEEFTAKYTGARPGPLAGLERTTTSTASRASVASDVPSSWDWRDYGAVTPVKDQKNCSCCWAFSVVAAVESINKIKTGELLTLSEQQVLDCSGAGDCKWGYPKSAFDYAIKTGITEDSNRQPPYYPPTRPGRTCANLTL
uniref:Cathepsin propeptide inhibitor domain-containing protein n=1 Tax=Oryza barthii TaxID=65489 RepID=A0A0D3HA47_9ORYZ